MKIIANTTDFHLDFRTAVAIGKFDGVHRGHQRLLWEILAQKERGHIACVFTFDPTPAVFFGRSDGKELTTREEKRKLFAQMGVDLLIEYPLTGETAAILPEQFVSEILAERMKAAFVAAGTDLSFGRSGAGDMALLRGLSKEYGFTVCEVDKVSFHGRVIGSTHIRSLVEAGYMEEAAEFLGRPYSLSGEVTRGNRIGRTIGFPTVNLLPAENKLLPPRGVYFSEVRVGAEKYRAITNVGYKPTVTQKHILGAESYLYDFHQEIYGEEIEVFLLRFRRPEMQFAGLRELQEQLQRDIEEGRKEL